MRNIPKIIESEFDGRGKCLSFVLFPLSALGKDENIDCTPCEVRSIELKALFSLGDILSNVSIAKSKLQNIETLSRRNEFCVPDDIRKVIRLKNRIMDKTMKDITDTLVKVRKGECGAFEFELIEQTFQESSSVLDQFFQQMEPILARIEFINNAKAAGALYIGNISSFEEARRKIKPDDEYYVLFYAHMTFDEDTFENMGLFNSLLKKGKIPCFLADVDMQSDLGVQEGVPNGTRICHYIRDEYTDCDMYKTYKADREFNMIRSLCKMRPFKNKPKGRAVIHLICPGSLNGGECSSEKQQWVCVECKSVMEYGFDDMFYCDCGKEFMNTFEFRCTDVNHGDEFKAFETDVLKMKLDEIKVVPEINILVLGETGVGKVRHFITHFIYVVKIANRLFLFFNISVDLDQCSSELFDVSNFTRGYRYRRLALSRANKVRASR